MAGKGTSSDTIFDVEAISDEIFRVRKPDTNSSREIRDDILRNFFGYTEMDISALDRENTGYFYISDKRDPRNWATYIHVREWQTDNQGKVPITMPIKLIDNLVNFRDQRIFTAITTAAGAISDAGLQQKFIDDLNKILKFDSKTRLDALMDLMLLASYSFSTRNGIAGALDYVSAQGYGDNPFIQIARAKSRVGDGSQSTSISIMLGAAVKNAGSQFTSAVEKNIASLDGTDAAYINQEASYIYKQIGNDGEFQERDWTARFYAMTDTEKSMIKAGDVISITAPGPDVMSTPRPDTETRTELKGVEVAHEDSKKLFGEADKATREIETTDPAASDSGLLTEQGKNRVRTVIWNGKDGNKPPEQSRPNKYDRTEITRYVLNEKQMVVANALTASAGLFVEVNKYATFAVRMNEITNYLNKRRELVKKIQNENSHLVPERPEFYKKLINQINEGARRSVNPAEKKQAQMLIDRLGVILEQSYALYGR